MPAIQAAATPLAGAAPGRSGISFARGYFTVERKNVAKMPSAANRLSRICLTKAALCADNSNYRNLELATVQGEGDRGLFEIPDHNPEREPDGKAKILT